METVSALQEKTILQWDCVGGRPKEGRFPCMLQPLGSRGFWPHRQAYSVLHLHPRWVLEIERKALCCCDAIDVNHVVVQGNWLS